MRTSITVTLTNVLPLVLATGLWAADKAPLAEGKFRELPLGSVKPEGWLKDQLTVQANGLTGHLDEYWESLAKTGWKGQDGESWERGPYYLDGLVPLAYLLDDPRLIAKVKAWMEPILASGRADGWFGPVKNTDRWPLSVALKVLTQYYEATNDARAMKLIEGYFGYLRREKPDWPDKEWRGVRAMENAVTALWLYRQTGDASALGVADSIFKNSFNWTGYFTDFRYTCKIPGPGLKGGTMIKTPEGHEIMFGHPSHVVNIAMAVKYPGIYFLRSGDERHRQAAFDAIANLDKYHGQAAGRFSGDEHLAGRNPSQGTELCAVVEYMFSLENLVAALGDVELADRLEVLAYNANPGACTADYWGHQYDQQANQMLASVAQRIWSTNHDTSNLYGLEPNFGCCTANMHQGWPKYAARMWMATPDKGLAAIAYGPNKVKAKVADGATVEITQKTNYPFDGRIELSITTDKPAKFPLSLRIPAWAEGAELKVGDEKITASPKTFARIEREWKSGDRVMLTLPMTLRAERRFNDSVSIVRGPLWFALRIGQKFNQLVSHHATLPSCDWEVVPTTPWNYALSVDDRSPEKSIIVQCGSISKTPYDPNSPPIVLKAKGRQLPEWTLYRNSADAPPKSPVKSDAPLTDLELVPYGSTQLRITEFPVLAE